MLPNDGTVWWCPAKDCGFTKPRWEKDQVQNILGGGIVCPCGTKMVVKHGSTVRPPENDGAAVYEDSKQ